MARKKLQKLFALLLTFSLSMSLLSVGAFAAEGETELESLTLPSPISVAYGTPEEDIGLPETLTGTVKQEEAPVETEALQTEQVPGVVEKIPTPETSGETTPPETSGETTDAETGVLIATDTSADPAPDETVEIPIPVRWTCEEGYDGWTADKYHFTADLGDYTYQGKHDITVTVTVTDPKGVIIADDEFTTLDEAIEEAPEGATIELLGNAKLNIGFNKTLTFTGNGKILIDKQLTSNGEGWMCFGLGDPTRVLTFDGEDLEVEWNSEVGTAPWLMLSLSGTMNVTNGAKVTFTVDSGSTGSRNAIYMNEGSVINVTNGSTFIINGNDTEGKAGQAIQLDKAGASTINVTGNSIFEINGTNRGYVNSPTIYVEDSTFTVQNCTSNGSNGGKFTAINSQITYKNNAGHGLSAGNVTIQNSTVDCNNNGLFGLTYSGNLTVDGTSVINANGNAVNGSGAGIRASSSSGTSLVEAGAQISILNNQHNGLENYGKFTFEDGVVLRVNNNDERTTNGGGIYNGSAGVLTLPADTQIMNNHAAQTGGGICNAGSVIIPASVLLYNNHADDAGDDIFSHAAASVTFSAVGSDWVLDDCDDAIDGWYDDSADARWEAHEKPLHAVEFTNVGTVNGALALKAAHGLIPLDPDDPDLPDWEVSKSKTATNLDANYESQVTLSLPAADYERTMDVVFVIDDTHAGSKIFEEAASNLLNELAGKTTLDIKAGIVAFDAVSRDWLSATSGGAYSGLVSIKDAGALNALETAVSTQLDYSGEGYQKKVGGTNTEWAVDMAEEMLSTGTGEEKYIIMFSDLYGYIYRGDLTIDGTTYHDVPVSKRIGKWDQGSMSMGIKYSSFADAYAHRNDPENQTPDGFFRDSSWESYWSTYGSATPENTISMEYQVDSHTFSGFEKSLCMTYDNLAKAAGTAKIILINNSFPIGDAANAQPMVQEMLDELEDNGYIKSYRYETARASDALTGDAASGVFAGLREDLIQLVDAGSKVVDVIGYGTDNEDNDYNFDFVNDIDALTLTVNGKELPAQEIELVDSFFTNSHETACYVFGEATETAYPYVLHYYANGEDGQSDECFVWEINVPVTKDTPVQLTYSVKLTNPQTADGTYGQFDADGSEHYASLLTNLSATLYPMDSNGKQGTLENFAKPTVSYTVKDEGTNPGPGPGGDDDDDDDDDDAHVTIPDDDTPTTDIPGDIPSTDIPDGDTPTTDVPGTDLDNPDVPLADVPKTGDASALWLALSALSGTGLAGVTFLGRKKHDEE